MKKARIAPMPKVQDDSREMLVKNKKRENNTEKKFSLEGAVDLLAKTKAKQKWAVLKNTVRFKSNLRKAYEEINHCLLKDKMVGVQCEHRNTIECLLEQHSVNENAHKKRENYIRGSVKNKEVSKALIKYFISLSQTEETEMKAVDFNYLENMFNSGVDINAVDKHGQCVLHEVARAWHTDVAQFLLQHGSMINHPDHYGRTPLHVAAAVDYHEMVEFLLLHGADINARTYGEDQTPIHYSAKNDAIGALQFLLNNGANINDVDYKQRTPLQLAAELDRSGTAQILIEEGAPAGVYDESKMAALVLMIEKMPNVAQQALDQFYTTNRASRRQYFYLNFLIPPTEQKYCFAKSPLEVAVECKQYQLLLHPVFQRLTEVKWQALGKWGSWLYGVANLLLCIVWTARLCTIPINPQKMYQNNDVLGSFFDTIAVVTFVILVGSEIRQYFKARRKNDNHKQWREKQLERDLEYVHPRWPEERAYLEREMRDVMDKKSSYVQDKWNYFDWLTYFLMFGTIVAQAVNVTHRTSASNDSLRALGSVTLIFMWLRMLKYARPFRMFGLFVVMLSHVVYDTIRIFYLSIHFFIPYIAAFWIIFGIYSIDGYTMKHGDLFYNIFQMMVVGDYNFTELSAHSQIMSRLLCGTYIFFGGIVCLNLFIALLSDTFQRVYDNAKATAEMQRVEAIVNLETDITTKRLQKHREWVTMNCAPESLYYDDDMADSESNNLKRLQHQIMSKLGDVSNYLENKFGKHEEHEHQDEHEIAMGKENHYLSGTEKENHYLSATENAKSNETIFKEMREVMKSMNDFKVQYYKSMIQTRAEIAGLGLMLKDLIEQSNKKQEKRQKKKKQKRMDQISESMNKKPITRTEKPEETNQKIQIQSHSFRRREVILPTIKDTMNKPTKNNHMGSVHENEQKENETQSSGSDSYLSVANDENHKAVATNAENPLQTIKSTQEIAKGNMTESQNTTSQTNEGFFEGYTFEDRAQHDPNDQLIKSTWNTIFSHILQTQHNDTIENRAIAHSIHQFESPVRMSSSTLRVSPRLKTIDVIEEESEPKE